MTNTKSLVSLGNAVIVCCTKNSEQYLDSGLENIETISKLFRKCSYIFVENDSQDNTKNVINTWGKDKEGFHFLCYDGLDKAEKSRTIRLEIVRNSYLNLLKTNKSFLDTNFVIIIDLDDRATYPLDSNALFSSISFLQNRENAAAVFANQIGTYYDLWALRHNLFCPSDCWHDVMNYALRHQCSDREAFERVYEHLPKNFDQFDTPIRVESAFGGLGIYKYKFILNSKIPYCGSEVHYVFGEENFFYKTQTCEHVSFHNGIALQGGELFIDPNLINGNNSIHDKFNSSAFRGLLIH